MKTQRECGKKTVLPVLAQGMRIARPFVALGHVVSAAGNGEDYACVSSRRRHMRVLHIPEKCLFVRFCSPPRVSLLLAPGASLHSYDTPHVIDG